MVPWRNALILTVAVFLLPFPLTWLLKSLGGSLGPVVLLYSLIAGGISAFFWCLAVWRTVSGINRVLALVVFIPAGVFEIVLLLNAFIAITALMGAMDYQLM